MKTKRQQQQQQKKYLLGKFIMHMSERPIWRIDQRCREHHISQRNECNVIQSNFTHGSEIQSKWQRWYPDKGHNNNNNFVSEWWKRIFCFTSHHNTLSYINLSDCELETCLLDKVRFNECLFFYQYQKQWHWLKWIIIQMNYLHHFHILNFESFYQMNYHHCHITTTDFHDCH